MLANPVTATVEASGEAGVVEIVQPSRAAASSSMPKRSRGFWVCDYCEVAFDDYEQARAHETQACPVTRGRAGGGAGAGQQQPHHQSYHQHPTYGGGDPMAQMAGYSYEQQHQRLLQQQQHGGGGHINSMWARLLLEAGQSVYLSEADSMACRSLELFQLADPTSSTPQQQPQNEPSNLQLGLRCYYCRDRAATTAAVRDPHYVVPNSVAALGVNVRLLAENHFLTCPNTPTDIVNILRLALQKRNQMREQGGAPWQEEEHSQRTLVDFCMARCHQLAVINKVPEKTGITLDNTSGQAAAPLELQQHHHPGSLTAGAVVDPGLSVASQDPSKAVPQNRWEQGSAPPDPTSYAGSSAYHHPHHAHPPSAGSNDQMEPMPLQPQPQQQQQQQQGQQAHDPQQQQQTPYGSMASFPFFQAPNGDWMCRYCANVPPEYREQHFIWSTPSKEPPATNFVNHHLQFCREFNNAQQQRTSNVGYFSQQQQQQQQQQGAGPLGDYQFLGLPSPAAAAAPAGYTTQQQQQQQQQHEQQQPWTTSTTTPASTMSAQQQQQQPGFHPQDYSQRRSIPVEPSVPASPYDPPVSLNAAAATAAATTTATSQEYSPVVTRGGRLTPSRRREGVSASAATVRGGRGDDIDVTSRRAMEHLIANDLSQFDNNGNPVTEEERLVVDEDRLLLTDYFYHLMKQLRLVRFSESDRRTRGGKREKIRVGYGGLQCVHCSDAANARKFFWSNVDRLANSFAEIPGHILKCRRCPQTTKDALLQLKKLHPEQMARLPRGSQKVFFRRMWRRLHDDDPTPPDSGAATAAASSASGVEDSAAASSSARITSGRGSTKRRRRHRAGASTPPPQQQQQQQQQQRLAPLDTKPPASELFSPDRTAGSDESFILFERPATEAAKALADASMQTGPPSPSSRVLLAIPEDKEWLSDTDCFVRRQIEVFCATRDDVHASQLDRKYGIQEGQVGIRCAHCGPAARLNAVSYPFAISGIYESVREFQRLHLDECTNLPVAVKSKLAQLKGCSSLSSVLRKYYVLSAQALGLHDTKDGVRAGAKSVPVGSQATTTFAFTEVVPPAAAGTTESTTTPQQPTTTTTTAPKDETTTTLPPMSGGGGEGGVASPGMLSRTTSPGIGSAGISPVGLGGGGDEDDPFSAAASVDDDQQQGEYSVAASRKRKPEDDEPESGPEDKKPSPLG